MKLILYTLYFMVIFVIGFSLINNCSFAIAKNNSSIHSDWSNELVGSFTVTKAKSIFLDTNNIMSSLEHQVNNISSAIDKNNNSFYDILLPHINNLSSQLDGIRNFTLTMIQNGDSTKKNIWEIESIWVFISAIATAGAAIAAAVATGYTAKQVRKSKKVNEAQIYLSLRELFSKHEEIQKNLKAGKWNERDTGPITDSNTSEELAKVDSYLRFFEYCYILIKNDIIDPKTFKDMYEPYINDITRNYQIMQMINEEGWILFPKLLERLGELK